MRTNSRILGWLGVIGLAASALVVAAPGVAQADTNFHNLTLKHGWTDTSFGTAHAQAKLVSGVVYLKGAIATTGTNTNPFRVPTNLRPASNVFLKVDMCGITSGRVEIKPSGEATVQASTDFANAQCITSLDGASYALSAPTALTLKNGWTNAGSGTSSPAATIISGIVHLKGAIATTGSNLNPFQLPAGLRPTTDVYVPVGLCKGANGRMRIEPTGDVFIDPEGPVSDAKCFTGLDGVWFAQSASGTVTLKNGWTNAPASTSNAARKLLTGIVFLKGAVNDGTSSLVFTLPAADRPTNTEFVPAELCNAVNGAIEIVPNGNVFVQSEGTLRDAQCFTSLDGAAFGL